MQNAFHLIITKETENTDAIVFDGVHRSDNHRGEAKSTTSDFILEIIGRHIFHNFQLYPFLLTQRILAIFRLPHGHHIEQQ